MCIPDDGIDVRLGRLLESRALLEQLITELSRGKKSINVQLHALPTTTPKVRRYIQEQPANRSHESIAQDLGVDATTVKRWRYRDSVQDGSHTAKRFQTTPNLLQEWLVVELRNTLVLTLDDLLVVTREYTNPDISRSGLGRCLCRHGVNRLRDLLPETEPKP